MTYSQGVQLKKIRDHAKKKSIKLSPTIEKILNRFENDEEYVNLIETRVTNYFKESIETLLREKSNNAVGFKDLLSPNSFKNKIASFSEKEFEIMYTIPLNDSFKKYFQNDWKTKFENYYDKHIDKKRLVSITGVRVCPYCNRNFINVTENANTSQLDHFFSKSEYPLFALCFYNLIPSCYGCNNKKGDNEFVISPYDENVEDINSLLTFSYEVNNADIFTSKDGINVTLRYNEEKVEAKDLKDAQEHLDLSSLYELHSDIVQELLWKKSVYTESYQANLNQILKVKPLSKGEVGRIITGTYTDKEDYGKRPLSKMITEISEEIGLIGENE